jgi:hypothetical protein
MKRFFFDLEGEGNVSDPGGLIANSQPSVQRRGLQWS